MPDPVSHDPLSLFNPLDAPFGAGLVLLYTSPGGGADRGTRLVGIHVTNHTTAAVLYRLTHTEFGGAAAAAKAIAWDVSIPADGVDRILGEGIILNPGDMLHHEASVANSLAIHGYGWEMTN